MLILRTRRVAARFKPGRSRSLRASSEWFLLQTHNNFRTELPLPAI
jgi:hypothetical protein